MRTHARQLFCLLLLTTLGAPALFAAELTPTKTKERVEVSGVAYVSPAMVKGWLDHGQAVTFLDVRQEDEFTAGHIEHATNIHYDQVATIANRLPHDHPIVVYCIHSAQRAPIAAKTLSTLGFTNVSILEGGIVAWQADGLPLQASDLAQTPKILPKTERCDKLQNTSKSQEQVAAKSR